MKTIKPRICIIHLKAKMVHLDNLLPLYLELKAHAISDEAILVMPDRSSFEFVKKNEVILDAITASNAQLIFMHKYKSRILNLIRLVWLLRDYLLRSAISIQCSWQHGRAVDFLVGFNRLVWRGRLFLSRLSNLSKEIEEKMRTFADLTASLDAAKKVTSSANGAAEAELERRNTVNERKASAKAANSDAVLVSYPVSVGDRLWSINFTPDVKPRNIGNPRSFPTWQSYLQEVTSRYLSPTLPRPYFFFVLGTINLPNPDQGNVSDDSTFRLCLSALKDFSKDIHTVFKPHPVTDMDQLKSILEEVGYENYSIVFVHPIILAKNALFSIANYSSTVLADANAGGCPTIDFARYDSRGDRVIENKSLLIDAVDYYIDGDVQKLQKTVKYLLDQRSSESRKGLSENSGIAPQPTASIGEILELG
jgi:hypothetical protein